MRLFVLVLGLCAAVRVFGAEPATVDDDVEAVRKAIASYVNAFNEADAKALAQHWTEKGEFVLPGGTTLRGRQELEAQFTADFADPPHAKLELVDPQVELLAPSVAVETGIARVIVPDAEPVETEYRVVHVKTPEGWRIDRVQEAAAVEPPPSHYNNLQSLEWMIGSWVNADDQGVFESRCRWTTNANFISRTFRVAADGENELEGTQIIGWDPVNETIRSWTFDSDGGFAVGRWSDEGDRWVVKSLHVLPDGRRASSTNIYEPLASGQVRFRSVGRQVDGELLPSIGPVEVARSVE